MTQETYNQETVSINQAECYHPNCSEPVTWPAGMHEVYCSEECATEAREGKAHD